MFRGSLNIINKCNVDFVYGDWTGRPVFPVQIDIQRDGVNTGEVVTLNSQKEAFELMEKYQNLIKTTNQIPQP